MQDPRYRRLHSGLVQGSGYKVGSYKRVRSGASRSFIFAFVLAFTLSATSIEWLSFTSNTVPYSIFRIVSPGANCSEAYAITFFIFSSLAFLAIARMYRILRRTVYLPLALTIILLWAISSLSFCAFHVPTYLMIGCLLFIVAAKVTLLDGRAGFLLFVSAPWVFIQALSAAIAV